MKMLCRVFIRRVVAAADMAAVFAEPEMHPTRADLQAIFAAVGARFDGYDVVQMFAGLHWGLLVAVQIR